MPRTRSLRWVLTCGAVLLFLLAGRALDAFGRFRQAAVEDTVGLVEKQLASLQPELGHPAVVGVSAVTFFADGADELATLLQNPVHRGASLLQLRATHEARLTALAYAVAPSTALLLVVGAPGTRYAMTGDAAAAGKALAVELRYPGAEWAVAQLSSPKFVILSFDAVGPAEIRIGARTFRSIAATKVAKLRRAFLRDLVAKGRTATGERFEVAHDSGVGFVLLRLKPAR